MPGSGMDRRLEEAAARSPELAAMLLRPRGGAAARTRRLALVAGGVVLAIGLVWLAAASGGRRSASEPRYRAEEIDDSHYLSPMKTAVEGPGEETAAFSGFAISVETVPPGAIVTIADVPRGEAPVLAGLACAPGSKVSVRAELAGHPPAERTTACRADTLVKLTVRLGK